MSWAVMADVPNPIVVDAAGTAGTGYVLKAYLPGTTTSIAIAIDATGGSPQTSITANAEGKWEVSGNEVLPYIDRAHKWGIFANATDAAANTPFYMGPFDTVPPALVLETANSVSSSSNVIELDYDTGNYFYTTLTEDITTVTLSNPPASGSVCSLIWEIIQDSTARTITWPASVEWSSGNAPTLSTGSGDVDIITLMTRDGGTTWRGFISGQDFS